ncbi:DNA replication ATP-dependent helicase/nuclease DNA2-like isoform X2 [Watersipora subatra]
MKGKIDVTVDCSRKRGSSDVVPLELKTGRPSSSAEHKGQVTMYSMMLSEKYPGTLAPDNLTPGLLVYLKDGSMQEVTHSSAAVKGLVNLRNELCQGLLQGVCNSNDEFTVEPLPEPINQRRMCESCPHLLTCSLHQRVFGDFTAPPEHIMNTLVPEAIGHLTNLHLEYFTKWSKLLLIEAGTEAKWKTIRDLWTKSVAERVSLGACLSNLSLLEKCKISSNTFQVILTCADTISTKLAAGDIVVVSEADSKVVILTTGSIRRMADHHITLHLDRELVKTKTYCIDKYDCYSSGGAGFTNLARLMEDTAQSAKLRSILIDGRSPAFRTLISCDPEDKLKKITEPLNAKQKKVIKQGLSLQDYLVIHGYPGTGKTSTIVALVEALRCQGMSVLITSYTHSAVDNILLKLKQKGVEFIRLGSASRVHSDIHNYTADHLTKDICTVDELAAFYSQFQVVGTTCLGVAHSMLAKRRFDVCIVDEASQIVQPICLGPLFYASSFILVGDGQQLPPLIKSTHAKLLGMEQTLLDCLGKRHHHAVVELTQQYRMNEVIMSMSNQLTYDNQLECSTEQVKTATLKHVGQELDFSNFGTEDMWIKAVCSPALSDSLVFLNTSGCAPSPSKKYICSSTEASIVCAACQLLIKAGIPADTIGVITPYQAQVQLLKAMLDPTDIEVNTVDQYQGRDKSVIVISFARTSTNTLDHSKKGAGILSDRRRLNVAITRAKHKLILVGNVDTLSSYSPVLKLISLLEPPQVISMPSNWSLSSVF